MSEIDTGAKTELQRYWNPQGGGVEPHDSGLLYLRDDVDAVIAALAAERDDLLQALRTADSYLDKGLDQIARNVTRAAILKHGGAQMTDDTLHHLRPLTDDEQAMFDRHTAIGVRDQPRIVIDQQSFDIDNAGRPWQRERAEWYRRQMAIALARMVAAENERLRAEAAKLAEALRWYAGNVCNCNRHGSDGDMARDRLANDIGNRARDALAKWEAAQK